MKKISTLGFAVLDRSSETCYKGLIRVVRTGAFSLCISFAGLWRAVVWNVGCESGCSYRHGGDSSRLYCYKNKKVLGETESDTIFQKIMI